MLRLLLLAVLLAPQDDVDDLLRRLGDADAAVREKASAALASRGDAARAALEKARTSQDPEIRARATAVLMSIDPAFYLSCQQKTQRPLKFMLLADAKNDSPDTCSITDGARFSFSRRAWAPDGQSLGTVFEIQMEPCLQGTIEWSVAGVRGSAAGVETCDVHSPRLVYLPGPAPANAVVLVKGLRRWTCDLPLEFKDPADGQTKRLGPFGVSLAWPCVVVEADAPVKAPVLNQILKPEDIRYTLKPSVNRFGGRQNFVVRIGCGGVRPGTTVPAAWCGCDGKPTKLVRTPDPMLQTLKVSPSGRPPLEDLESISLMLHLPVEEPFEVTSPPLR
jgi:hypothetical protein